MHSLPKIRRLKPDPYSAGRRSYEEGEPFNPDFGLKFIGWGTISAQCLYESGRLTAAGVEHDAESKNRLPKPGKSRRRLRSF